LPGRTDDRTDGKASGDIVKEIFRDSLTEARVCLDEFLADEAALTGLAGIANLVCESYRAGGKVLIAGNGGSMADALHFAEEMTGRFRADRRPLAALALAEATHLSCVANDYGFDHIFGRLVEAFGRPGDVLILLSTSGNSSNTLLAAGAARDRGMRVVALLGRDGGKLRALCDSSVIAPGKTPDRIQEIHMLALHILVEAIEVGLELA